MTIRSRISAARLKHDKHDGRSDDANAVFAKSNMQMFRSPKIFQMVADHIRKMIISGELKPGESLLPEAALIERFSTSRGSIG